MLGMPGLRTFSLSATPENDGVSCSEHGVFVGRVPLLERACVTWIVRPIAELNDELTISYRLPVDITSKANALALVAAAFNRGDRAMAAIACARMQCATQGASSGTNAEVLVATRSEYQAAVHERVGTTACTVRRR
jgi:hypothetical protein